MVFVMLPGLLEVQHVQAGLRARAGVPLPNRVAPLAWRRAARAASRSHLRDAKNAAAAAAGRQSRSASRLPLPPWLPRVTAKASVRRRQVVSGASVSFGAKVAVAATLGGEIAIAPATPHADESASALNFLDERFNKLLPDTAGQERYIGLSSFYCRNADVAIMAFDITNRESYKALMTRYVELLHMVDDFALKVVVGTKTDLLKDCKRQVSSAEAEMFARNLNHTAAKDKAPYFETSSVTGNNIETVFEYIVERCYPGSPLLSCCLRQTHEQEHKSVALTPRVLRFAKTTAGCCL
ncbi:putative RAB-20 [Ixodes scapularis]